MRRGLAFLPLLFALPLSAQSRAFVLVNALQVPAIVLDVESGQRCMAAHACAEGNPLMGSSRGSQYVEMFSMAAVSTLWSYRQRRRGGRWWIAPLSVAAGHTFAGAWNSMRSGQK